jgi:hypothetical protein
MSRLVRCADLDYCSVGKFESVVGIFHHSPVGMLLMTLTSKKSARLPRFAPSWIRSQRPNTRRTQAAPRSPHGIGRFLQIGKIICGDRGLAFDPVNRSEGNASAAASMKARSPRWAGRSQSCGVLPTSGLWVCTTHIACVDSATDRMSVLRCGCVERTSSPLAVKTDRMSILRSRC